MARNTQNKPFADYAIEINLTIRRKDDTYHSETLADVDHKETLTMAEADVLTVFDNLVAEATQKAIKQTGIKREFEQNMLALEAGPEY